MKLNKILYMIVTGMALVSLSGCDKYLDIMPDNRTEINSQENVQALLVSAYPSTDYMLLTEFMADNVDDFGPSNPYYDRFIEQVYNWEDVTESDNEDPESLWEASYGAIAAANLAIQAIERMGGAEATGMQAEMAEALLCRAYNHFILVNMFCKNYNTLTSDSDLGIPYSLEPETTLDPKYERGTVAQVYDLIKKDIEAALPHVSDSYYTVPKYHFNKKAAYAFATRFYLFHEEWQNAVDCADEVLGSEPASMLRDWQYVSTMPQQEQPVVEHYIDATLNCNLLLMTAYSKMGLAWRNYYVYARYSHSNFLAQNEDAIALAALWGGDNTTYYSGIKNYSGTNMNRAIFWKLPYLFEYTDPVAGIGYYRTVYPAFTADETLLSRAEAKILLRDYDGACDDMNLWVSNVARNPKPLTTDSIQTFFNDHADPADPSKTITVSYTTWDVSTVKKHLNPAFSIGKEEELQECMLQALLGLKRIDALGLGLRWFDVKRYGIEIAHRQVNTAGRPITLLDVLTVDDDRRAMQLPRKVRDAGMEPNPRNNK